MATSLLSTLLFFVWPHSSFWPKSLIYVFYFATSFSSSCFTLPTCSTCFIPLSVFLHAFFCAFLFSKIAIFSIKKKSLIFPNHKHIPPYFLCSISVFTSVLFLELTHVMSTIFIIIFIIFFYISLFIISFSRPCPPLLSGKSGF